MSDSPRTDLGDRLVGLAERVPGERWLVPALGAWALVYAAYLLTHDVGAYGAGLYLTGAEQLVKHGYRLPARIPGYTQHGVPFAYPPLMLYVAAAARDLTGVGPITYSLYVPGLLVLLSVVYVARELLDSPCLVGLASTLFAVTPAVLQWHLSAGGIVRTGAFTLTLAGAYAGLRLFRAKATRWVIPATVLFGLTVLAHPTYTVFFGLTYLLLFARFDRTARGLLLGATVAVGGVLLAAPWWLTVVKMHGFSVFTAAAGTHSGLGGGADRVVTELVYPLDPNLEVAFYLGVYPGALYALSRGRWFLPAWLALPEFVIGKTRFQFVAGSMLSTVLLVKAVPRFAARLDVRGTRRIETTAAVFAVILIVGAAVGTAFAGSALDTHLGSTTQPPFIDNADRDAMRWAATHTEQDASFVVLGDAAEWFPLFTDRTILVGPWGVEWVSPRRYRYQLEFYESVSDCDDADCVTTHLRRGEFSPNYLYVPKGHYTVRGIDHRQRGELTSTMDAAERYDPVFENEGVVIYHVADADDETPAAPPT